MLEVLISLVVVMIGLLGLGALQARTQQAQLESYQRAQALVLMQDMVDRINANRKAARCYVVTTDPAGGTPYLGTGNGTAAACTAWGTLVSQTLAVNDLNQWNARLQGAAESDAGGNTGAMIGGRGCVTYDAATDTYQVTVAWQGLVPTVDPASVDATFTCGRGLYGAEELRRVVSTSFRIANLN